MRHQPIDTVHLAECRLIAEMMLVPGTRVERFDGVSVDEYPDLGWRGVSHVFLHVSAERDIPSPQPDPEFELLHAAGDCWQEVWQAWPIQDPATGRVRVEAMRTV